MLARIPNCGSVGVNKDLSQHDLPINAWTDAQNVRFMSNGCWSFNGQSEVFGAASVIPYHLMPLTVLEQRYWLYIGLTKVYAVGSVAGVSTHTNLTKQTAGVDVNLLGGPNTITSTLLGGIPIINSGGLDVPQSWDLNLTHRFTDLANWPTNFYCKRMIAYKNFLVALSITKTLAGPDTGVYPYMVKWSDAAVPGAVPGSWDISDPAGEAGEVDLAEGPDHIVDGLVLRDSLIIYKEQSVWRMDYTGGQDVFSFRKVLGTSGALNRNCIVEVDGWHFVLTGSDVVVHDGSQGQSVLNDVTRRYLFNNIDIEGSNYCFVFKSNYTSEVYVCYPSAGSIGTGVTTCDTAMVWNYANRTVSFKTMPAIRHAAFGPVPPGLNQSWDSDSDSWDSDVSLWGGPDFAPDRARALLAPDELKILMLDGSAAQDGDQVEFVLERRSLSLGEPEKRKLITRIRPRIYGNAGGTVNILVGSQVDTFSEPVWSDPIPYTIGSSISADCFVDGRYLAVRFESGTAFQVRLDSYDIEYEYSGDW